MMHWNLINDTVEKLWLISVYDDREYFRKAAKDAMIAIEELIKENAELKKNK